MSTTINVQFTRIGTNHAAAPFEWSTQNDVDDVFDLDEDDLQEFATGIGDRILGAMVEQLGLPDDAPLSKCGFEIGYGEGFILWEGAEAGSFTYTVTTRASLS